MIDHRRSIDMKHAERFHKMIGLAMITILLCICISTGLADGIPPVTITGRKVTLDLRC